VADKKAGDNQIESDSYIPASQNRQQWKIG